MEKMYLGLIVIMVICFGQARSQTCVGPIPLAFGIPQTGSTCGAQNNFTRFHACGNTFMDGPEIVYRYTPDGTLLAPECISIQVTEGTSGTNQRSVFVLDGCPDAGGTTCIAQAVYEGTTSTTISIDDLFLSAGNDYYIVVSSADNTAGTLCHDFNIVLGIGSCNTPGTGVTCANANAITALPFNASNVPLCGSYDDYNLGNISCNSLYGEDYVFEYTPAANECIDLLLSCPDPNMYVTLFNSCPTDPGAIHCVASANTGLTRGSATLSQVALGGGKTYYIIVSIDDINSTCAPFDISINTANCCPTGSTCYNPDTISAIPFSKTGVNTCFSCNDYNNGMSCNNIGLNGFDYVFAYTPVIDDCIMITAQGVGGWQNSSTLTVFNGCPEDASTSCIAQNTAPAGNVSLNVFLLPGETYYIVLSNQGGNLLSNQNSCGAYNVSITGISGNDPGTSCISPYIIPSLPFNQTGMSTQCFLNNYTLDTVCTGIPIPAMNGDDFVFEYTSPGSEIINIKLTGTAANVGLIVLDNCPITPGVNCIASTVSANPVLCGVELTDPGTYYIIVDRTSGFTNFNIQIEDASAGMDCANPYAIDSLPFSQTGLSTQCFLNDYQTNAACGGTPAMNGDDFVFEYSSPGSEMVNIVINGARCCVNRLFILDNCPTTPGVNCIRSTPAATNPSLCGVSLADPGTYYIIFDRDGGFTDFDINIEQTNQPGMDCSNPYTIPSIPFSETGFTTACYGNDYNSAHACGNWFINGDDFVFEYTATADECLSITASNLTTQGGLFVFDGCPDAPGTTCIAQAASCNNVSFCDNISVIADLTPGTYYIVVSARDNTAIQNFDLYLETSFSDATINTTIKRPLCAFENAITLQANSNGGTWSGPGITNANTGLFDPAIAGDGIHTITYSIGSGQCARIDTIQIRVLDDCHCSPSFVQNPSFEGTPYPNIITSLPWGTCMPGTTPDTQPGNFWVTLPPSHGNSYIGMLHQWLSGLEDWSEGAGQLLVNPMKAGFPYFFYIDLANSGPGPVFSGGCIGLQIRGGFSMCDKTELLWSSGSVSHQTWETYNVSFVPGLPYTSITIVGMNLECDSCQNVTTSQCPSMNYILVDNISPLMYMNPKIKITSPTASSNQPCTFNVTGTTDSIPASVTLTGDFTGSPMNVPINMLDPLNWQASVSYPSSFGGSTSIIAIATFSSGCTDADTIAVNIIDIVPDFTASDFCYGTGNSFIDSSIITVGNITSWSWDFGDGVGTSNQKNPVYTYANPGTYDVRLTVTSDAGCTDTVAKTITVYDLSLATSFTASNCNESDGEACVTVSGGTTPYIFHWDDSNNQTTSCATSIPSGIYTVTVTDANQCTATASVPVSDLGAPTITIDSIIGNTCSGGSNGAIYVTTTGDASPFTYTWSNGATAEDITEVFAGIYSLIASDMNNCNAVINATVEGPPALAVAVNNITPVTCNGNSDGAIDITVTGGTGEYSYLWSNEAATEYINNLSAGSYSVTVTDDNSCTATTDMTVTEPPVLAAIIANIINACFAESNGAIDITVTGGTIMANGAYNYAWSNGTNTRDISGITAGNYNVTVTDANGCTDIADTTIIEHPALLVDIAAITQVSCGGESDGAIDMNVTGGANSYTYTWSNGAITEDISRLAAGNYSVTVTDSNNCTVTNSATVTEPDPLTATIINVNHLVCYNDSNGSATANVSGGTPPYTYFWTPSANTNAMATGLNAGTYTLAVNDSNNCQQTAMITITEPDSLVVAISNDTTICERELITLQATATGGTALYTYNWNPGSMSTASVTVNPALSTTYTLAVTDVNNCQAAPQSVTVDVNPLPQVSFTADPENGCAPLCVSLNNITPNSSIATWNFGNGQTGSGAIITHCYPESGIYSITLDVRDSNGCENALAVPDLIQVFPAPVAGFSITPPTSAPVNSLVIFNDQSIGADHWLWNFGDILNSTSTLQNPKFTYAELGSYTVNLTVSNNEGCTDTTSHVILIEPEFTLYIPNAFTPDNDGLNDFFALQGAHFNSFEMEIFNRWGESIYHTAHPNPSRGEGLWDGTVNGKDSAPQGVYVYKIRVEDFKGQRHYYVGNVTLIR